jgi:lipoprotein-releasing system permease protein
MYRLLLSWRYLRTRWIAMASIVSVMLGVATLIVVNSVMAGFSLEMNNRLHAILSDLVFESHSLDGTPDPEGQMRQIRRVIGEDVQGMTPIVHVPALLRMKVRGEFHTRQINLIGIDDATYAKVSDFSQYLLHPENQKQVSFLLREDGYASERAALQPSGWTHRRRWAEFEKELLRAGMAGWSKVICRVTPTRRNLKEPSLTQPMNNILASCWASPSAACVAELPRVRYAISICPDQATMSK